MASARPNPFRDRRPFTRVIIGGKIVKAALTKINDHDVVYDWNVQKGTNTSGATAAFRGLNLLEGVKLSFVCANGDGSTAEEDYDDMCDHVEALSIQRKSGQQGGKPPTRSIENPILTRAGLTAICLKSWREEPDESGGWLWELVVIQYAPPQPAATGAQDPTKPSTGSASTVDPQIKALQEARDKLAQQAAAV